MFIGYLWVEFSGFTPIPTQDQTSKHGKEIPQKREWVHMGPTGLSNLYGFENK